MSKAALFYRQIFTSRRDDELERIAQVKRFLELYTADDSFRAELLRRTNDRRDWAARHHIAVDPDDLLPLWHPDFIGRVSSGIEACSPIADEYARFVAELREHRALSRAQGAMLGACPRFHAWRDRQMARCASEIPGSAGSIIHAVAAFELSLGCSKACWFCGVSAEKFAGYYAYDEKNRTLWRGVLRAMYDQLGDASHSGFCYWATDPSDNPHYARFIDDYRLVTGHVPQTTTAAPLKNLALTRELMRFSRTYPSHPVRFSVVTLRSLHEIHNTFTPRELLDVELICQNREALGVMAMAGRVRDLKKTRDLQRRASSPIARDSAAFQRIREEHATIACVTGFLVNMVKQTIALITPTQASDRWPLGYRVHEERAFHDPVEFRAHMDELIAHHMPDVLAPTAFVRFRDDLVRDWRPGDPTNQLRLKGKWATHETQGPPFLGRLGELIAQGGQTLESLQGYLAVEGVAADHVAGVLQHLSQQGFFDDEPGRNLRGSTSRLYSVHLPVAG